MHNHSFDFDIPRETVVVVVVTGGRTHCVSSDSHEEVSVAKWIHTVCGGDNTIRSDKCASACKEIVARRIFTFNVQCCHPAVCCTWCICSTHHARRGIHIIDHFCCPRGGDVEMVLRNIRQICANCVRRFYAKAYRRRRRRSTCCSAADDRPRGT